MKVLAESQRLGGLAFSQSILMATLRSGFGGLIVGEEREGVEVDFDEVLVVLTEFLDLIGP